MNGKPIRFHQVNTAGIQNEWWFHRSGCRQWLQAVRNTVTNEVLESFLPPETARVKFRFHRQTD